MNVKKIISVLLAMLIVTTSFSLLPVSASALETEETKETVITESGTTGDCTFAAEIDSESVELGVINLPDDEDAPNYPEIIKFENTNNGVMVYWTAFPGAESYRLFYWNGEKWRSVGSTSELSYLHKNVENGKSYLYIVRAVDEWGEYCSDFNRDGYENVYLVKENTENELVKKSGTTGDCTWELDEDGTLTISGDGDMEDYSINDYESWGDTIKTVIINAGVTNIGNLAFANCTSLTSITIPDSVTSIGNDAFSECESLTNIVIPDSVTSIGDRAFDSCRSLTSITIPNSVASIGYSAFSFCESLTSITLPDSVTSIGESAFCFCRSLMSITIPNSVTKIGESAFYFCRNLTSITIPSSVTSIGDDAFGWCTSLTSITIPNSVTSIGASAFCECISLKSIEIPKKVTSIGDQMFYGCINLESLTIPSNVTSIGESAFCRCTSLNSITIPSSVKSIGEHAFGFFYNFNLNTHHGEYTKIEDFVIIGKSGSEAQSFAKENGFIFEEDTENELVKKSGITGDCTWTLDDKGTLTISGNGAMGDYMYDNNTESEQIINLDYQAMFKCYGLNYWDFPLPTESGLSGDDLIFYDSLVNIASPINRTPWGTEIKSVIINDGVKSIGACAFLGCTELTKVSIPDSVNNIGDFAFFDCEKLASVTIPENMERIGQKAFAFSRQLRSITIPKNVKDIGLSPFEGCANLTNITVDKDNSYYDSRNDCNAIVSKKDSALLSGCKSTIIPEGVMNIYPNAFFGMLYDTTYFYNVELKTINIPDSVENIGSNAFAFCNQLERVSIPSNVYIVNNKAFLNCTHLDYVDIANSKCDMEIGMGAFFGCDFSQITIPPRVNKIGEYAIGYSDAFEKNYYKIDNFAIKGKSGSEAQSFAKENGFRFIDTNFEWGIDNWSFDNKQEYFNYDINDNDTEIIQNIEEKFELSAKQKNDLNAWFTNKDYMGTGMCFGMTVSEIFARKGILKLSEYKLNDIINYNDINNSNTRLVISVIQGIFNTKYGDNYLQNLKLSTFNPVDYKQSDFLRNIETKLTNGNNLVMIGYKEGYKDSEKNNYHAVLGYGTEEG